MNPATGSLPLFLANLQALAQGRATASTPSVNFREIPELKDIIERHQGRDHVKSFDVVQRLKRRFSLRPELSYRFARERLRSQVQRANAELPELMPQAAKWFRRDPKDWGDAVKLAEILFKLYPNTSNEPWSVELGYRAGQDGIPQRLLSPEVVSEVAQKLGMQIRNRLLEIGGRIMLEGNKDWSWSDALEMAVYLKTLSWQGHPGVEVYRGVLLDLSQEVIVPDYLVRTKGVRTKGVKA